ncbi:hypothetical protein JY409_06315 [Stenotrophomonas maltophilia]|nr:hypothetical protein [Stenotrophomonas maltophilia]HEL4259056.1 hypothetical protein [Stenotrophomonas maltophilia]
MQHYLTSGDRVAGDEAAADRIAAAFDSSPHAVQTSEPPDHQVHAPD